MRNSFFYIVFSFFIILTIVSCQNDDAPVVYEKGTNEYINQWTWSQMKKYYYWNNEMPQKTDISLPPKDYFAGLVSDSDPYSYIFNSQLPETSPKNLRKQFGFEISFVEYNGQVLGAILYVLTDSPAKRSGLKRGQYITHINGTKLDQSNFDGLYNNLVASAQAQLTIKNYTEALGFSVPQEISISRGFTFSQPVFTSVITEGSTRVGYIEIPHFDIHQAGIFMNAFQNFKSQSVNKVIIDLRYNGGGDVSSASALCSILAPGISGDDMFIQFKGNSNGGVINQSFKEALMMNETTVSFDALRNVHPEIDRVYILCGNNTASASEIIINNLKPFMDVITIGEKTMGKDVAGFPIEDESDSGDNAWILYPAIYKLYNASGQGNYSSGIIPSVILDELAQVEIFPLGDKRETLLKNALDILFRNGRTTEGKQLLKKLKNYPQPEPVSVQIKL